MHSPDAITKAATVRAALVLFGDNSEIRTVISFVGSCWTCTSVWRRQREVDLLTPWKKPKCTHFSYW